MQSSIQIQVQQNKDRIFFQIIKFQKGIILTSFKSKILSLSSIQIYKHFQFINFQESTLQYFQRMHNEAQEGKLKIRQFKDTSQIFKSLGGLKLWEARHSMVMNFIEQKQIQTMIDFGCNEATLMQKLQRGTQIKRLIGVDIDDSAIQKALQNNIPEPRQNDLQYQRQYDQLVQVYKGSALQKYREFKNLRPNLVTLIEVIEHIQEKYHPQINENIFGFIKPQYVIITTPNSDFNCLFKWGPQTKFRHDDHKFQWTRQEFRQYVQKIQQKYDYESQITGLGEPIRQQDAEKGFCTQIAIFTRKGKEEKDQSTHDIVPVREQKQKLILEYLIPVFPLCLVHQHLNYSWHSNKERLIETAFNQLTYRCVLNDGFMTWMQAIKQLRSKTILSKLCEVQDKFRFQYFLKQFISQRYKSKPQFGIICTENGIEKLVNLNDQSFYNSADKLDFQIEQQINSYQLISENSDAKMVEQTIAQKRSEIKIYDFNQDGYKFLNRTRMRKPHSSKVKVKKSSSSSSSSSVKSSSSNSKGQSDDSWGKVGEPDSQSEKKVSKKKIAGFKQRKQC